MPDDLTQPPIDKLLPQVNISDINQVDATTLTFSVEVILEPRDPDEGGGE
jgi:hypothetical protein